MSRHGTVCESLDLVWQPASGQTAHQTLLRPGLQVIWLDHAGSQGRWVLDEFPPDMFPLGSIEYHDAYHYGCTVPPEYVVETRLEGCEGGDRG